MVENNNITRYYLVVNVTKKYKRTQCTRLILKVDLLTSTRY